MSIRLLGCNAINCFILAALLLFPELKTLAKINEVAAPEAENFAGFYLGAGGGYLFSNKISSQYNNGASTGYDYLNGPEATAFAGFNYLLRAQWLIGTEIGLDYSNARGNYINNDESTSAGRQTLQNDEYIRIKLGYIHNNFLTYVSLGYSYARWNFSGGPSPDSGFADPYNAAKQNLSGGTIGVGFERHIYQHISCRGEYLYTRYTTNNQNLAPGYPSVTMTNTHPSVNSLMLSLIYHF